MAMTQTLAVEWAPHQIRVNAVAPGPIESPGAARQLWSIGRSDVEAHHGRACRSAGGAAPTKSRTPCVSRVAARVVHHRRRADGRRRPVAESRYIRLSDATRARPVGDMARLPRISELDAKSAGSGFFLCARKERRIGPTAASLPRAASCRTSPARWSPRSFRTSTQTDAQFERRRVRRGAGARAICSTAGSSSSSTRSGASFRRTPTAASAKKTASRARRGPSTRCGRSCRAASPASRNRRSASCCTDIVDAQRRSAAHLAGGAAGASRVPQRTARAHPEDHGSVDLSRRDVRRRARSADCRRAAARHRQARRSCRTTSRPTTRSKATSSATS